MLWCAVMKCCDVMWCHFVSWEYGVEQWSWWCYVVMLFRVFDCGPVVTTMLVMWSAVVSCWDFYCVSLGVV